MNHEQFTYGDYVYNIYSDDEFTIKERAEYKVVNQNYEVFTKDKEYATTIRNINKAENYRYLEYNKGE